MFADPLAEMYRGIGGYVYVANNPINFIDPTGMHIEPGSASEKEANGIKQQTTAKISELTKELGGMKSDDRRRDELTQRIGELNTTLDDIQKMFDDKKNEYKYSIIEEGGAPAAQFTGKNEEKNLDVITMFVENTMESKIHESRHGGQHARGELNIVTGEGYGVNDEISAYRAQYSWNKNLQYVDLNVSDMVLSNRAKAGQDPGKGRVININQIHKTFVNKLVDPGQRLIYPPSSIPLNIWNNN